jgi:hypothetical protein
MNLFKRFSTYLVIVLSTILSGCYYDSDPRPQSLITDDSKITSDILPVYKTPKCSLPENSIECSYLNYAFDIDMVKKYGRDSIVAWEKNNPQNSILILFNNIYDQDGSYEIRQSILYSGTSTTCIVLRGNKYGGTNQITACNSGVLLLKTTPTGFDIVICDAPFNYNLNFKSYTGKFSAHFIVPR